MALLCWQDILSSLLFPEHPLALSARDFFVCGNWPGKFSELGLVLMFPVESFIPKLQLFWDHRVLSPIILFLSLSGWACSLLSLWTLPLRWCDLSQVEPGCHAPGSVLLDGPSVGRLFLQLASYELTCRIPDSNWRLQWNIPVLGDVFIKIKSLLLRLIFFFFFFCYCTIYNLVEKYLSQYKINREKTLFELCCLNCHALSLKELQSC